MIIMNDLVERTVLGKRRSLQLCFIRFVLVQFPIFLFLYSLSQCFIKMICSFENLLNVQAVLWLSYQFMFFFIRKN